MSAALRAASRWQRDFVGALRGLSRDGARPMVLNQQRQVTDDGVLPLVVTLDTSEIESVDGGLALQTAERFEIYVPADPARPPAVVVTHDRFLGFPHVLHGRQLCIYLVPSREWDPTGGAVAFMNRLWGWLIDAAYGLFSAADALYHATGGVPVGASPSQLVVVRDSLPAEPARLWGVRRTDRRLDIGMEPSSDSIPIAYWPCDRSLPIGIGSTVGDLINTLTRNGTFRPAAVLAMLRGQARRSTPAEDHVYFLLSIPHPAGGESQLVGGRLERQKVLDAPALDTVRALPIDWCAVSDERAAVATRRDSTTPAAGFLNATVCLVGCGALGSWLAEFIVRAGARTVLLFDNAMILGGLLVRQNYVEADLGSPKSAALAARLRAIADGVTVIDGSVPDADGQSHLITAADFVIDATANVAAAHQLDGLIAAHEGASPVFVRVATDPASATRGIVVVRAPDDPRSLEVIDGEAERVLLARSDLEDFRSFWSRRVPHGQIIPTRGCSFPTFHGSAADVAAVAGIMTSLLGRHRTQSRAGTHLFRLPGSGLPADVWLPV